MSLLRRFSSPESGRTGRELRIEGMVDPHVHLRGLNWSHKGTFYSETAAALAGGYWAVLDMPNTDPATISTKQLRQKLLAIGAQAVCDWGLYFGASVERNWPQYLDVIDDVCGLKIYGNHTTGNLWIDDPDLREAHFRAWPPEKVIAIHAEEDTVYDFLELVRRYRKKTHFVHISTAYEIDLLTAAKAEGLPVTLGVTPHHLYLTQDDVPRLGGFGLMKPELKTRTDQEALWEALASGVVDVVESDHAPHTVVEKQSASPPYGVPGLETTLPLMVMAVKAGRISLARMIELVSTNPQRIFGLTPPPGTYTVIDMETPYVLDGQKMFTACHWTPFEGMEVVGRVLENWIRGTLAYNGRVLCGTGFGQNLFRGE